MRLPLARLRWQVLEEQLLTKLELQAKEEMDPMKRLAKEVRDLPLD